MNKNYLDLYENVISEELHDSLLNERLIGNSSISKRNGIYVIAVRRLNYNTKDLVYNYIYYPSIFIKSFGAFLKAKNVNSIRFKE